LLSSALAYVSTGCLGGQFKTANPHPAINLPLSRQHCWKTVRYCSCSVAAEEASQLSRSFQMDGLQVWAMD